MFCNTGSRGNRNSFIFSLVTATPLKFKTHSHFNLNLSYAVKVSLCRGMKKTSQLLVSFREEIERGRRKKNVLLMMFMVVFPGSRRYSTENPIIWHRQSTLLLTATFKHVRRTFAENVNNYRTARNSVIIKKTTTTKSERKTTAKRPLTI